MSLDTTTTTDENDAGEGELLRKRNLALERRALQSGWPLTPEVRAALLQRQIDCALDPKTAPRDARLAMMAILQADALNVARERTDVTEAIAANKAGSADVQLSLCAIVKALVGERAPSAPAPKVVEQLTSHQTDAP